MDNKNIPTFALTSASTNIASQAIVLNFDKIFSDEQEKHKEIGKEKTGDLRTFKTTKELLHEFEGQMTSWPIENFPSFIEFTKKMIGDKSQELFMDDFAFSQQKACQALIKKIESYFSNLRIKTMEKGKIVTSLNTDKVLPETLANYKKYLILALKTTNERIALFKSEIEMAQNNNDPTNESKFNYAYLEDLATKSDAGNLLKELILTKT
ncbi:MAG: hypothetical protein NTZ49_04460 [Candidatus Parcubacteria bacterium]|nr:hypothetical protein [Candidatus Parcubacteria bacterium]